jgi:hypothetical protein
VEKGWGLGAENESLEDYEVQYVIPNILRDNGITFIDFWTPQIFFLTASDFPETGFPEKYTSSKKYKKLENRKIENLYTAEDKIIGLNNLVFHKREDFYNYMRQFEGFMVPEPVQIPEKQPEKKELNDAIIDTTHFEYIKVPFQKEIKKEKWSDIKKKDRKKKQKGRTYNTLTFEYANHKLIYDTVQISAM